MDTISAMIYRKFTLTGYNHKKFLTLNCGIVIAEKYLHISLFYVLYLTEVLYQFEFE